MPLSVLYTESIFFQKVVAFVQGFVLIIEVLAPELGKAALLAPFIQILAQKIYDAFAHHVERHLSHECHVRMIIKTPHKLTTTCYYFYVNIISSR